MHAFCAENFDREIGCTEQEWEGWLPSAIGPHAYQQVARALTARIDDGQLALCWRVAEPRVMGLTRTPRLIVSFRFSGLGDAQRYSFMRRFELYLQRRGSGHFAPPG